MIQPRSPRAPQTLGWAWAFTFALVALAFAAAPTRTSAQIPIRISPGPLAKAHGELEGLSNCVRCHDAGRELSASRCLTCHEPIADRIASRKGVHRDATECVSCHIEHAGVDADLLNLDTRTFNHAVQTGFALDGVHATSTVDCASCHKSRTFLDASPSCISCHEDVHKGSLGTHCTSCHSTQATFKQSRDSFDHTVTRFLLTGAHGGVACEECHKTGTVSRTDIFRGREFGACTACHEDPHKKTFGGGCTSCHTTEKWDTRSVNHSKTRFPLVGAHTQVACAKCHQRKVMTKPVRFDQCSACHVNVHRESVKEDCRECHDETTFSGAAFDHGRRTAFALEGKHQDLACVKCHTNVSDSSVPLAQKVVDYGGAQSACVTCHLDKDPHKSEFGRVCDSCHQPSTFSVKDFRHPREPDFHAGQHEPVRCEKCHLPDQTLAPTRAKAPAQECASCHDDVHLGQVSTTCERCHAVNGVEFAAVKFSHEQSRFPLTGKHQATECTKCHHAETRLFPSRIGTAVVFSSIGTECRTCHDDLHLGQVDARCETCHETASFAVASFKHRGMDDFFGGVHGRYACKDCHKTEHGIFPTGNGTAMRFLVGRTCDACHRGY